MCVYLVYSSDRIHLSTCTTLQAMMGSTELETKVEDPPRGTRVYDLPRMEESSYYHDCLWRQATAMEEYEETRHYEDDYEETDEGTIYYGETIQYEEYLL